MKLTKYEKETIINFNQEDDFASIYTCDEAWIRTMDKLVKKSREITEEKRDDDSRTYKVPKSWVKVRTPMELTEAQRLKLASSARSNFGK